MNHNKGKTITNKKSYRSKQNAPKNSMNWHFMKIKGDNQVINSKKEVS